MEKMLLTLLVALFSFAPSLQASQTAQWDASEPQQYEETVYLTKEALQILNGEAPWLDDVPEPYRYVGEEGIIDMRYVVFDTDEGEVFVGVRLQYPYAVDIDTLSLSTYKIVDYKVMMLYVSDDGVWGHAHQTGGYVFLVTDKPRLIADIWPASDAPDTAMYASEMCANDLHINIWQEEQVTLQNGSYVLPHMLIATEGLYPEHEAIMAQEMFMEQEPRFHGYEKNGRRVCNDRECPHRVRRDRRHVERVPQEKPGRVTGAHASRPICASCCYCSSE